MRFSQALVQDPTPLSNVSFDPCPSATYVDSAPPEPEPEPEPDHVSGVPTVAAVEDECDCPGARVDELGSCQSEALCVMLEKGSSDLVLSSESFLRSCLVVIVAS